MTAHMSAKARHARSVARLAAVQALYQMDVSGVGVEAVVREFGDHRFDHIIEGVDMAKADTVFFAELVRGAVKSQGDVDKIVVAHLATGWRLERIDATARAILRAGAFELLHGPDTPTEVVIDEYVGIAKSFFEGAEPGFVNGALDAIARHARP